MGACGCGSRTESSVVEHGGYSYCSECGEQLEQILDTDMEWRNDQGVSYGSIRARVGGRGNKLLPEASMRTYVRVRKTARACERRMGRGIIRQHSWTAGSISYYERSMQSIYRKIQEACTKLEIGNDIRHNAEMIFTCTNAVYPSRADTRTGIIAASIILATRLAEVPRSPRELSRIFSTSPAVITKGSKAIHMALHGSHLLSTPKTPKGGGSSVLHVSRADDYVPRFCSRLGLPTDIADEAKELARKASKARVIRENSPSSVAGGAILYVVELAQAPARVKLSTKKEIAAVSNVSVVTITKVRKVLYTYRSHLFTAESIARIRGKK